MDLKLETALTLLVLWIRWLTPVNAQVKGCNLKPHPSDKTKYRVTDASGSVVTIMDCGPKTTFNQISCTCDTTGGSSSSTAGGFFGTNTPSLGTDPVMSMLMNTQRGMLRGNQGLPSFPGFDRLTSTRDFVAKAPAQPPSAFDLLNQMLQARGISSHPTSEALERLMFSQRSINPFPKPMVDPVIGSKGSSNSISKSTLDKVLNNQGSTSSLPKSRLPAMKPRKKVESSGGGIPLSVRGLMKSPKSAPPKEPKVNDLLMNVLQPKPKRSRKQHGIPLKLQELLSNLPSKVTVSSSAKSSKFEAGGAKAKRLQEEKKRLQGMQRDQKLERQRVRGANNRQRKPPAISAKSSLPPPPVPTGSSVQDQLAIQQQIQALMKRLEKIKTSGNKNSPSLSPRKTSTRKDTNQRMPSSRSSSKEFAAMKRRIEGKKNPKINVPPPPLTRKPSSSRDRGLDKTHASLGKSSTRDGSGKTTGLSSLVSSIGMGTGGSGGSSPDVASVLASMGMGTSPGSASSSSGISNILASMGLGASKGKSSSRDMSSTMESLGVNRMSGGASSSPDISKILASSGKGSPGLTSMSSALASMRLGGGTGSSPDMASIMASMGLSGAGSSPEMASAFGSMGPGGGVGGSPDMASTIASMGLSRGPGSSPDMARAMASAMASSMGGSGAGSSPDMARAMAGFGLSGGGASTSGSGPAVPDFSSMLLGLGGVGSGTTGSAGTGSSTGTSGAAGSGLNALAQMKMLSMRGGVDMDTLLNAQGAMNPMGSMQGLATGIRKVNPLTVRMLDHHDVVDVGDLTPQGMGQFLGMLSRRGV